MRAHSALFSAVFWACGGFGSVLGRPIWAVADFCADGRVAGGCKGASGDVAGGGGGG